MIKQIVVGVAVAVASAGCGVIFKPTEPSRRLDVRVSGELFDSDRGYHFAALHEPGAGVIRLDVRYPIGSADDPVGKAGLAHLVEHLLFDIEIPTTVGKSSIAAELGRIALYWNAETHPDYTIYQVVAAPTALEELVQLELDRVRIGCAGLSKQTFERERAVVLAELRERNGASGAQTAKTVTEAVFPEGHPYRQTDSIESVAALTYQDACGFIASVYRHGDVSVVASGAVDRAALQTAAAHHLAGAPKRSPAVRVLPRALSPRPGVVHIQADVSEPMIIATWPLPAHATRDYRMLQVARAWIPAYLADYASEYQWGHGAYAYVMGGDYAPVLAVVVTLNSRSDADEAIAAVGKSVDLAMRDLYRPGDTKDSHTWTLRWQGAAESLLARWESLAGRNDLVAEMMQSATGTDTVVARIAELAAATPAQVHALGVAWFDEARMRVLVVDPSPTSTRSPNRTAPPLSGHAAGVHVDGALADRPLALPPAVATPPVERYVTPNGMTVVLWPHGSTPIVHGRLVIDSGHAHDAVGTEGLAALAGASTVLDDSLVFDSRELSTQVDALVGSLAGELRRPGYEITDTGLAEIRKQLVRTDTAEATKYEQDLLVALYGEGHPYARLGITAASTKRISRDGAMAWARTHVVPANATMVISGQFDPALVKAHITYDTDMVARGHDSADIQTPSRTGARFVRGVVTKATPSVALFAGFVGGRGIDEHHAMRLVLARVLALHLARLRTDQALTYGVQVAYEPKRAGGQWSITASVDATRAAEGASSLLAALATMRADPESYREELVLARQQVLESYLLVGSDSGSMADRLAELARFDLDAAAADRLAGTIAAVTLTPFHAFLQRELAADGQVFGAFGNAAPVDAALAAARSPAIVTPPADPPALATPPADMPAPAVPSGDMPAPVTPPGDTAAPPATPGPPAP